MLKNFLNSEEDNAYVMESISTMALMLDEDPTVACESDANAEGIVKKFKTKVAAIVTKVKEFIQKIVNWIKVKFFNLLKMDFEINQELWKDAQEVLKLCDKAQASFMTVLFAKLKVAVATKREDMEGLMNAKAQIEDAIEEVKNSQAYHYLFGDNAKYSQSNSKTVAVKGSSLDNQKEKFQKALGALQEEVKNLDTTLSKAEDGAAKRIEVAISAVNLNIQLTNIRISVINKILSAKKERKTAKE